MILNGEYVEKLSDEELCMLEQLTYLDERAWFRVAFSIFKQFLVTICGKQVADVNVDIYLVESNVIWNDGCND